MPASYTLTYYRNHNSSDTTTKSYTLSSVTSTLKTIDEIGWEAPTGYTFHAWNTAADGSGQERTPGETGSSAYPWYAIWERLPVTYTTTSTELTTVADAIRAKGGTSAALEWPSGFAQAIFDIPSGGGAEMATVSLLSVNDFCPANIYYTDSSMTVQHTTYGSVESVEMPIGSLIYCRGNNGPAFMAQNSGVSQVYAETSPRVLNAIYEVTG